MDTILDRLSRAEEEADAGGPKPSEIDISVRADHVGSFWNIKPADPALLKPRDGSNSARQSVGTRGTARTRGSTRGGTRRSRRTSPTKGEDSPGRRSPITPALSDAGSPGLDTRSIASRTSIGSRSTMRSRTSKSRAGSGQSGAFDLQQRAKQYVAKTAVEMAALQEVEAKIAELQRTISNYHHRLGGVLAVKENERNVAIQTDIMERRIVKAQTEYMDQIAANNKMRQEVNMWRREMLFLNKANGAIMADLNRLDKENNELAQSIKTKGHGQQEAETEMEMIRLRAEVDEDALREKYEELNGDPDMVGFTMPEVPSAEDMAEANMTRERELQDTLATTRWNMSSTYEQDQNSEGMTASEVFAVISQQTGVETPEEFADKASKAEATNYALYTRVDVLMHEAHNMKEALRKLRQEREAACAAAQGHHDSRKDELEELDRSLRAAKERIEAQRQSFASTSEAAKAIRSGLLRLLDLFGVGENDSSSQVTSLTKLYGIFEERVRAVMLAYITTFFKPELSNLQQRHHRSRKHHDKPASSLEEMQKHAETERGSAPLVPALAFAIGPAEKTDQLRDRLTTVSIPSTDGPKDSKQMAAFVRPWQMLAASQHGGSSQRDATSQDGSGERGRKGSRFSMSSNQDVEELFGDRPVTVPSSMERTRRTSDKRPGSMPATRSEANLGRKRSSKKSSSNGFGSTSKSTTSLPQL